MVSVSGPLWSYRAPCLPPCPVQSGHILPPRSVTSGRIPPPCQVVFCLVRPPGLILFYFVLPPREVLCCQAASIGSAFLCGAFSVHLKDTSSNFPSSRLRMEPNPISWQSASVVCRASSP